jgi:hypothetical protein
MGARSDSPPPSWYEPPDLIEDDDPEDVAADEPLTVIAGLVWWRQAL